MSDKVRPIYDANGVPIGMEISLTTAGGGPPSRAQYDAFVARMDTLARQAARVAKGRNVPDTPAKRDAALVAIAEAIALMWFIERYEDEGNE